MSVFIYIYIYVNMKPTDVAIKSNTIEKMSFSGSEFYEDARSEVEKKTREFYPTYRGREASTQESGDGDKMHRAGRRAARW